MPLLGAGRLALALPGSGDTRSRWSALRELGATDLSTARLAEGHVDAVAILAELGRTDIGADGLLGVWAAGPQEQLTATCESGGWVLEGRKRWCSGAQGLHAALVTAQAASGTRLFLVPLDTPGVAPCAGTWPAVGMAATDSLDVEFHTVRLRADAVVGGPGAYVERPGFWHGAIGVAACWLGGAEGVAQALRPRAAECGDEHALAHLGAVDARLYAAEAVLDAAATHIDADPHDEAGTARLLALRVRQLVHDTCAEVLDRTGRATGADPLCHDADHARRVADLTVYLRQHHGERDLAELGQAVVDEAAHGGTARTG